MQPSRKPSDSRYYTSNLSSSSSQQERRQQQRRQEQSPFAGRNGDSFRDKQTQQEPSLRSLIDTLASSALGSIPPGYESQISIPSNATWRCSFCYNSYPIEYARLDRLLGYFRCTTCRCVPNFEIYNFGQLQRIQGLEYGVVTSLNYHRQPQPPHSIFVWVCCNCGRSWPQVPQPQRISSSTPPEASIDRGRLLRRILHRARGSSRDLLPLRDNPGSSATFIVTFNSGCLCAHYTCENCFRAVVLAEGESIIRRLQDGEVVKVSPERLQRKLAELREEVDDPDEYIS